MKESPKKVVDQEAKEKPLTPEYTAKLFFLSFRFSQGNVKLQEFIFDYIHLLNPQWHMDDGLRKEVEERVTPAIKKYLLEMPGKFHAKPELVLNDTEEVIVGQIKDTLKTFQESFETEQWLDRQELVGHIVSHLLTQDLHFMEKGRSRRGTGQRTPATDKFLSHIAFYGLLNHSTGMEEYDQMFKDITTYLKGKRETGETTGKVLGIIKKWNEMHPEEQVTW